MPNYVLAINKDKEFLRERCDEVVLNLFEKPRVTKIINDLKDTLNANVNLVALAASQLGIKERIFAIKFANGDIRAFINPAIIRTNGMHLSRETEIGIDDVEYIIPRCDEIFATYQTPEMTDNCDMNKFTGAVAEVFQQMNDLINGTLVEDIGLEILPGWDKASEEERQEIISMYLESLERKKSLSEDIVKSSPETQQLEKQINFMTKLQLGEIEIAELTDDEKKRVEEELKKKETKDAISV